MTIVRATRGRQRFVAQGIIAGISRRIIAARAAERANLPVTIELQPKFQAAPVKGASPVERMRGAKVVPLDGDTDLINIAIERPPTTFDFAPGVLLGRATGIHRANYDCCPAECKTGF